MVLTCTITLYRLREYQLMTILILCYPYFPPMLLYTGAISRRHWKATTVVECPTLFRFKHVQVTVPPSTSPTTDKSSNTEQLLIIWFGVLNAILILAIVITLVVWCWMRHSASKQKSVHSMCDVGLPAYLHNYLELETSFTQDGSDPLEFPYDQLQFLHLLGL